jgi:hypothetical protein
MDPTDSSLSSTRCVSSKTGSLTTALGGDAAADQAIAACGGDAREAVKALIVANHYLSSVCFPAGVLCDPEVLAERRMSALERVADVNRVSRQVRNVPSTEVAKPHSTTSSARGAAR